MQEMQVQSLGLKELLQKEMSTFSWKIPQTEEAWGHMDSDMTEWLRTACRVLKEMML